MSDFLCARCRDYLFDSPMQCPCGDRVCGPCYDYFKTSNDSKFVCPLCESEILLEDCFRDKAFTREFKETKIKCKSLNCPWEGRSEDYKLHLNNECMLAQEFCGNGYVTRKNMEQHTRSTCEKMEQTLENRIRILSHELKSEINQVRVEMSMKIQPVKDAATKVESAVQQLQEDFSEMALTVQTLQATSYNGVFIWKIPEVQRHRDEAKIGKTVSLYSAPFYTSRHGYKVCLRLYMNGDGSGKHTHLSFYVTIMRGEYDAFLQWPFNQIVKLFLRDQDKECDLIQLLYPDVKSVSFQQPQDDMNVAFGCPMFAPLPILNNSSYVKNDVMFLMCKIDN